MTFWNSRSLTRRQQRSWPSRVAASPFGVEPHQHASPVAAVGLLDEQALVDQAADLGGDVGRGELGVLGGRADGDCPRFLPGGAVPISTMNCEGGEGERAAEGLAAGVRPLC